MKLKFPSLVGLSSVVLSMTVSSTAQGASMNRVSSQDYISPAAKILLSRADIRAVGPALSSDKIEVSLILAYRNTRELQELVAAQQNPRSPIYDHFLTNEQWNERYAATSLTENQVVTYMATQGFTVTERTANHAILTFVGAAPSAERLFSTRLERVVQRGVVERFVALREVVVPKPLSSFVTSVLGLTTAGISVPMNALLPKTHPTASVNTSRLHRDVLPGPVTGQNGGLGPEPIASAFDLPVEHGYGGSGRIVGIITGGSYLPADYFAYVNAFKVPITGNVSLKQVGGGSPFNPNDGSQSLEADLDLETITGLAPNANIYLYSSPAPMSDRNETTAINDAINDGVDSLNISYGQCENQDTGFDNAIDSLANQGSSKGMTIVAASGDYGYNGCGNSKNQGQQQVPASDPFVTAAGGLQSPDSSDFQNAYAWSCTNSSYLCSGGGASVHYPRPPWQSTTHFSSGRNVPDIALLAGPPGIATIYNNSPTPVYGTSVASPIFAAAQAEIDQENGSRRGAATQALWNAFNTYGYSNQNPPLYRDITVGNNGQQAVSGYDFASGIGQPDLQSLSRVQI